MRRDSHSDENNGQESRNLVNLINHDLHEDETTDSDEVIFENTNIHLNLENTDFPNQEEVHINQPEEDIIENEKLQYTLNEDETKDIARNNATDNHIKEDIFKGNVHSNINEDENVDHSHEVKFENKNIENYSVTKDEIGENYLQIVGNIPDIKDGNDNESSCDKITDISENSDFSIKYIQDNNNIKSDNDSLCDKITHLSEKSDGDTNEDNAGNILLLNSSVTSSHDSSTPEDSRKNGRKKRKKISEQLKIANSRLKEEIKTNEVIQGKLREESDAKERLESNLSQLQTKYDGQLKEEEELRHQLHKKDELNSNLEAKQLELTHKLINMKTILSEQFDNQHTPVVEEALYPPPHLLLDEKLTTDMGEVKDTLYTTDNVNTSVNYKKDEAQDVIEGMEVAHSDQVESNIKAMVEQVIDDSHKKLRIITLEEEVEELNGKLNENKDKYNKNLEEALSALKQVQDTYAEMRDVVLEGYKQEVAVLNQRVRIAEEKSNEDLITGLRQELLDARLQQERSKQIYKDEMEILQKKDVEYGTHRKEMLSKIDQIKLDLEIKTDYNKAMQSSLEKTQLICDERKHKVDELNVQLRNFNANAEEMKGRICEKDGVISEMKLQLVKESEILAKEHAGKERLQMEVEVMESVKRQNQRLEEEIEEMSHKIKLRGTKIKFLKKHIKELEEQKEKAESLMLIIPEMQKKIDELNEEKERLKQNIIDKEIEEKESIQKIKDEKKEEEERLQKEKGDWERKILGIGKCIQIHEEENERNAIFTRPSSAPLLKPKPPTWKRDSIKNHSKSSLYRAPTLNPEYLYSYPEGRKATQKMKQHQEKIILSTQNRDNLFRSVTKPMSYSNASYKHICEGKYFPRISPRSKENNSFAPRVLVWGDDEGPANKMVAVGDLVLTALHSECSIHGHSSKEQAGIVKFIGFVDGNDEDVYLGIRLEEEVGYTDGIIQGKRYFRCEPRKGAFVHLNDIVKVLQTQTKHVPTLTM